MTRRSDHQLKKSRSQAKELFTTFGELCNEHSALQYKPHVLFNAGLMSGGDITFLFFSNHIAFGGLPTPEDVVITKMKYPDFPIAIIDQRQPLPDYLTNDSEIQIICFKQRP